MASDAEEASRREKAIENASIAISRAYGTLFFEICKAEEKIRRAATFEADRIVEVMRDYAQRSRYPRS